VAVAHAAFSKQVYIVSLLCTIGYYWILLVIFCLAFNNNVGYTMEVARPLAGRAR
jgi:hypothetical protein